MAYTEAQGRANRKYRNRVYDRAEIWFPKGEKDSVKVAATQAGKSLNDYILTAVREKMSRDAAQDAE